MGYLETQKKRECFGCEACVQICGKDAICMCADEEGFRYPQIDLSKCVSCGLCRKVCPHKEGTLEPHDIKYAFGGYLKDQQLRQDSTSGGAFSAIAESWCQEGYAIFGAAADGLEVSHSCVTDKVKLAGFRKSKYTQSKMGRSFIRAKEHLQKGERVLFSGTPCQIAGLKQFLNNTPQEYLLTVEVVCEGIPSPKYLFSFQNDIKRRYGCGISEIDYRNKDKPRWDFNVMKLTLENGRDIYIDRWLNPFFTLWIGRLMSRPSCYGCPYTAQTGLADITLGDLWGVHQYCPELYGENKGASLVLCNTEKGIAAFSSAKKLMLGHELDTSNVLAFQKRLRMPIEENPQREAFMHDLLAMDYRSLCGKWVPAPSLRLLWSKYVWGNRQKVFFWSLKNKMGPKKIIRGK